MTIIKIKFIFNIYIFIFKIIFIIKYSALIEVKKQNFEISKKNIKKWLREMPEEEKEKLRGKEQPNFKFYEMLIEIYVLHVLAPLEEYNSSIDFLEGEDYLTMDRKKVIKKKKKFLFLYNLK